MGLLLSILIGAIIVSILILIFMRTSTDFPKTWPQFKTELRFIISGIRGCAQDIGIGHLNKISK